MPREVVFEQLRLEPTIRDALREDVEREHRGRPVYTPVNTLTDLVAERNPAAIAELAARGYPLHGEGGGRYISVEAYLGRALVMLIDAGKLPGLSYTYGPKVQFHLRDE